MQKLFYPVPPLFAFPLLHLFLEAESHLPLRASPLFLTGRLLNLFWLFYFYAIKRILVQLVFSYLYANLQFCSSQLYFLYCHLSSGIPPILAPSCFFEYVEKHPVADPFMYAPLLSCAFFYRAVSPSTQNKTTMAWKVMHSLDKLYAFESCVTHPIALNNWTSSYCFSRFYRTVSHKTQRVSDANGWLKR